MIMIRIAFIWLALMLATPVMAETAQQRWIGDVPIMESMTIESDLGFAFDSPDGRIVVIYVSGMSNQSHLQDYYDMALIPLGWAMLAELEWKRESERLVITPAKVGDANLWKIAIMPE
ncbi:MAG: hypothetical protein ACPHW3_08575 [Candidatus Puniceispirillales bacterium]